MLHVLIVKLRQGASITRFRFSFYHICIFLLSHLNRILDGHWAYLGAQNEFQKASLKWTQSYMLAQLSSIILNKNCCMFFPPNPPPSLSSNLLLWSSSIFPYWDINISNTLRIIMCSLFGNELFQFIVLL